MAFDVTPTSGAAPYVFTADVVNKLGLDFGLYVAEFRSAAEVGSCPASALGGANNPEVAEILLDIGVHSTSSSIPDGSCRRYVFLIRRLVDSVIVSQMSVTIDNSM